MAKTFKDRVKEKQKSKFIGRSEHLNLFKNNLEAQDPIAIFNICGQGGVGKTHLSQQYKTFADENKCLTAYTDESIKSVLEWMDKVSEQFKGKNAELSEFDKRYKVYLQETKKLETDPEKPKGTFTSITKTLTKGLIREGKKMPGAELIGDLIDEGGIANTVSEWADFARKKMTNKDEVELVLEPLKVLSPLFWKGINGYATKYKFLAFFVDTFEETDKVLEDWLLDTLNGEYGDIPANLLLIIAGRDELNPNRWSAYNDMTQIIPLEPFTEDEAESYLLTHQITEESVKNDILKLSGRLPVLMAFLVITAKNSQGKLEDVCETAVERFLKWVSDETQRKIALAAAIPSKLNQDVIECLLEDKSQASKMFDWLINQPFVQKRGSYWAYHKVVREQMLRYIRTRSLKDWENRQLALVGYYTTLQTNLEIAEEEQFKNKDWFDFELERLYHALCTKPYKYLPIAIQMMVKKWYESGGKSADIFGEVLENAGNDNEQSPIKEWGEQIIKATQEAKKDNDEDFEQLIQAILEKNWVSENNHLTYLHNLMGILCTKKDKYDLAIQAFQEAIEIKPNDTINYYNLGYVYACKSEYDLAIQAYQKALEIKPNNEKAHNNLGNVYAYKSEYDLAIQAYQKAIEIKPSDANTYNNLGRAYADKLEYDLAIQAYQKAIEINPDNASVYHNLGLSYFDKSEYDLAIQALRKASEINPDDAKAYNNLGNVYAHKSEYNLAIEAYQKAIEINPDDAKAYYNLGNAYFHKLEHDLAIEAYQKAIEINPDNAKVYHNLGNVYAHKLEYDLAIQAFQKAIEINPDNAKFYYKLGLVYFDKSEYDLAIEAHQKALEINPDNAKDYNKLGLSYYCKSEYDLAIQAFQKALQLEPENLHDLNSLGVLLIETGRIQEAEEFLIQASKLGNEYANMNLGHVYLIQNQEHKALDYYQKSLSKYEGKKEFWQGMEDDFQYLEQYGITREYYEDVMKKIGEQE